MTRKLLLFLTCLSLMAGVTMARTVRGVVIEAATDDPIPGATVKCKGTPSIATATDVDGNFTLNVPDDEKYLVVSFIGMLTQDVEITSNDLTIFLEEAANNLDEVVVIGYGTTTKRKTTTSVSMMNAEAIAEVPVPNITQALAGRAAGLIVQQSAGGLNATSSISIRGGGTPLYVIDNIVSEEREFRNLNPADIESLSILKDAAGTAIYGQRAGNGIVIVTTKRGQAGKVNVDYQFDYTLSQPADLPKKLNSYDQARYWNLGYIYDGMSPYYDDSQLQKFLDGSDPEFYPNTNWQKEVLHSMAPEQRHQLTIRGGSERVKAYTALSYYDQNSLYRSDNLTYKRYNARTNITIDVKEIGLTVTTGLEAYISNMNQPSTGYYGVFSHIQNKWAGQVARNPFGQPYGETVDNPVQEISDEGGYSRQSDLNVRGTVDATWMIPWVKGLSITGRASYAILNQRTKNWNKIAPGYQWDGTQMALPSLPSLSKSTYFYDYYNTQLFANYNRDFGKNNVELTLGIEAAGSDYDNLVATRQNFVLDVDQFAAGPTDGQTTGGANGAQYRNASVIFRAHYDYAARYLAEFTLRHDGADKFPKNRRWGTFFAGSLGWNVSEESFWKESQMSKVWNMFKIRASWGEIGQDSGVGHYDYLSSYSVNQRGAYLGGSFYPTFSEPSALPSPDISWYTQRDFDIGFDFALFNNALSGSVDYFYKRTKGYLSPAERGYYAPLGMTLPSVVSDSEYRRWGVDFALQYNGRVGDFTYQVGGNFTFYDDKWDLYPGESEASIKNPRTRSSQRGNYFGNYLKNMGYFSSYQDILNSAVPNGELGYIMAGDVKYWDYNGDGKIDGNDQIPLGKESSPHGNYGITLAGQYKGLNISMLWQGATAYTMYVGNTLMGNGNNSANPGPVIYEFQTDIWSPDNTNALYPRPHSSYGNGMNNMGTAYPSDFWFVDAQYVRLKNLTIGYDFKHKFLKKENWLSKLYVSLTGHNLLTFSPAKKWGFDPEGYAGTSTGYNYPVSRIYTLTVNIGF